MKNRFVLAALTASMLSGCYSFRGPPPALDRGNVVHRDVGRVRTGYLYEDFRRKTLRASGCAEEPAQDVRQPEHIAQICDPRPASQAEIREFMEAGYALIQSDCEAYFAHMGRNQGRSRLARDMIAPIGAMITGIISIVRFEDSATRDDLIASLALASTTGRAALDLYDQHFLFGAANIDAVQRLVMDALSAHAQATLNPRVAISFNRAVNHLEANQNYCRPTRILALVREAITAGRIVARVPPPPAAGAGSGSQEPVAAVASPQQ